jgi:tripartite-type tricarboxylate transporter receptor subunit TctC
VSGPVPGTVTRFVIASSPGTGPDTMSRLLQPDLQQRWGRTIVIDNKPGAGGIIGIDAVAKAPPDGATLMIQTSTMFLLPSFYKEIPYDTLKGFTPITQVAWSTFALVVNNAVPAHDFKTLSAWIRSKNGKVNYASPGKGTENHLFMELLKQQTGLEMTHVPYRATANAIQDMIGDQVSLMFLPIATANTHAKNGNLRIIGCTSKERFPVFKEVPTLYEQGLTGFDFSNWYGTWGPAGMPADLTARYNQDFKAVLTNPATVAKFAEQGWMVKVGTPEELDTMGRNQLDRWREVVALTKVEID